MGDIADDLIDRLADDGWWPRRKGSGPDNFACRYCGQRGLHWGTKGTRWFPLEPSGRKHKCERAAAAEFTPLDP